MLLLLGAVLAGVPVSADAGCCTVVQVGAEDASSVVRVCEDTGNGSCGALLFAGPLALGESQAVCSSQPTVLYQEFDDATQQFAPPVEAVCDGTPVEI